MAPLSATGIDLSFCSVAGEMTNATVSSNSTFFDLMAASSARMFSHDAFAAVAAV